MATNDYENSDLQTASGIWQSVWGNLFKQFNEQMLSNDYLAAWKTLQIFKVQIPPECESDITETFNQAKKIMNKTTTGYTTIERYRAKKNQLNYEAPETLLQLMGKIRTSLYGRKWINKNLFAASPLSKNNPHIGEKE